MGFVGLFSNNSEYLSEILKSVGVFAENVSGKQELSEFDFIIADSTLSEDQLGRLFLHIKNGKSALILGTNKSIDNTFGLSRKGHSASKEIVIDKCKARIFDYTSYGTSDLKVIFPKKSDDNIIHTKKIGKGELVLFPFDFYKTIHLMTHGNDAIRDKDGDGVLRTEDAMELNESYFLHPSADILKMTLLDVLSSYLEYPIPLVWMHPESSNFSICVTHDSDGATSKDFEDIIKIDDSLGVTSTNFLIPYDPVTSDIKNKNMDIGMHTAYFYLPSAGNFTKKAIIHFNNILKVFPKSLFSYQKRSIDSKIGKKVYGNRTHGLVWYKLDDQPRWMAKKGIKFDSTFGSNFSYGYAFSTGMPYMLRERKGYTSYDILEFPLLLMDSALSKRFNDDLTKIRDSSSEFLDTSNKFHSLLTICTHPYMLKKDGYKKWYKDILAKSRKKGAFISTMSFFNDFWRKRADTRLEDISWDKGKLHLTVKNSHLPNGLSIALPRKFRGKEISDAYIDGKKVVLTNDQEHSFIALNEGVNEIIAVYKI